MTIIWKWLRAFALFSFLVLGGNVQLFAEGSWQMGLSEGTSHRQPLQSSTILYVDILNANEVINIHACGTSDTDTVRIEIFTENGVAALDTFDITGNTSVLCSNDFNGMLTGGSNYEPAATGTYRIKFSQTSQLNRFDIFVKSDNTVTDIDPRIDQGRLWGYKLNFNAGSYDDARSTSANLYAVVDGGFNGAYYVWELDLDNFAGYVYELSANELGLDSPNANGTIVAGLSAPTSGNSVTPQYKLYFSDPSSSYPRPNTLPEISNFRFEDDEGVDSSISPSDTINVQDTGNFLFTTNLATSGTYAIIIDVNKANPPGGLGDVFLNGSAAPGDNNVSWNGKDNNGNSIPNGSYPAQIVLKTGEFHFTARDVETSGGVGSVFKGLTINAVLDDGTVDTSSKVYWDDKTILNMSHTPDDTYNVDGSLKYHNWGGGSNRGLNEGNEKYIDTYAIGYAAVPVFTSLAIEPDDTPQTKMTGNVFDDVNGNGVRDSGEAGFSNIAVTITEPISGYTFNISTDSNGFYEAYTYEPSIIIDVNESMLPAGYIQTAGTDPETVDVSAGGSINVGADGYQAQADLLTTKTVNNATPNVGDTVTYTLTVKNNGAAEATNVSLTDQLPAGIIYDSDTPSQGTYNSATGLWTIGTLANGASVNLTLTGTVDSGTSSSTITNITTAASGDQTDLTTGNDDLNESITVNNRAPLAIDDTYTVAEEGSVTLLPLTADSDPDGDILALVSINGVNLTPGTAQAIPVTNGTVTVSTSGVIIFAPSVNYNGPVSFPYVITDGKGATAMANENITVTTVNDTPVADTPIAVQSNTDADTPSVDVSGNFSDPDGDTLTYTATGLPAGLTISPAGVISGTIDKAASQGGTNGVYSVTVTAKDPSGATVTDTFTWTVTNPAPTANTDTGSTPEDTQLVVAAAGILGNDTDPDGDTLLVTGYNVGGNSVTVGNPLVLTEGNLTIAANGSYVFDPAPDFNGPVPAVTYAISDGNGGTASSTLTITVTTVNDTPVADTPIAVQNNADADTPSVDVSGNFSDPDGDTLTYTATGLPTGLTISPAGVISGTIDKAASQGGTNGVYSVTVTAKDPSGATVTDTFTWTVTNPAPTATDNTKSTNEDTAVSGNVINNDDGNGVDSDPDGDTLSVTQFEVGGSTYTAGQTAELTEGNLTIAGSGAYTFTPTANSTDAMPQATYTLSDGEGGTDTATLDITVNSSNDMPVANPDTGTTQEDTPLVVTAASGLLLNDTDPDGDALSVTGYYVGGNSGTVGSPLVLTEGNLTIAADGSYTFDPAPDFNGPVPTVTYDIEDINGETASSILDITVTAVNDAPVAEDDSQSTSINTPVSIPVLNNDHDVENDSLTITDVNTTGTNGTVTFDANGTVIFTPETDFIGTTTFTYTVSDGNGGEDTATVTITVTDPTDPASNTVTAVADSANIEMDTNIDIQVLINDYDPEGDAFSLTNIVTPPVNGTAIIDDNGTPDDSSDDFISYEPNTDFIGNDTFEYEITDENGNRDIAIVTVTVVDTAADAVPNAVADAAITDKDVPVSIDVLDNDTHPDNDDLNITAFTQPANGVVTLDDGGTPADPSDDLLVYTPNPGFNGHDTFMYMITDSNGDRASAAVTVTLKRLILTLNAFCENDVPYISYDIKLQGLDPSGETATLTWTGAGGEEEIETGLALSNTHHLWAGAEVDASGNGTVWPGWNELSDGSFEEVYSDWRRWNPDQSDATVTVTLSVNPESTVTVQYPPATSVCSANPPQNTPAVVPGAPVATDNLNIPITHYGATVINVLANGDSFGANGPGTVEIKFTQPVYGTVGLDDGGTPNDPTDDVLIYTPQADINNVVDKFTYTITDAAGNTSTATVTLNVNCASTQRSDGGDALGTFSIILMMFLTLMTGLYFAREEEMRKEEKGEAS